MGETKALMNAEAIQKIKEFAEDKICLFCTQENGEILSRPMDTQQVEENGTMWFFSRKDSNKNNQILKDNRIYLMYMDTGKQHYLSLSGRAQIIIDKQKAAAIWDKLAKAWFKEGVDDPELTLVKVTPETGHYWDTKNGALISLIKIAVAAVTGKEEMDGGVEGDLRP